MSDIETNKIRSGELSANLIHDVLRDRRSDRRWRNIRFFFGFFIILLIVGLISFGKPSDSSSKKIGTVGGHDYVAYLKIDGIISPSGNASANELLPRLHKVFADKESKGVIIDINSPGGTPVQAAIIHDEILKLKKRFNKKVIIVGEDLLTSGAYYVAVSGDKIYVNPNTTVGSIGVVMEGFGFNDAIKKLGIDRRAIYSGENKDRLDPFLPENPMDVAKIKTILELVHQNFIQVVKDGRKDKLSQDKDLFTGDFWDGVTSIKLGLADELGNLTDAMQKEFNVGNYRDYSSSNSVLMGLLGQASSKFNLPLPNEQYHLSAKL